VVVLSAVRTAIGKYGGALKDIPPSDLGAVVVRESIRRSGVAPDDVGYVVFSHVIHTDAKDMFLARVAAVRGGAPIEAPTFTICGSGLEAIVSAAQAIRLADADVAIAGGAESISRAQYWIGIGALTEPLDDVHMGITAENIARKWAVARKDQDELALLSHRRAVEAIRRSIFKSQIVPIEVKIRNGPVLFDTDEQPRADTNLEALARMKPIFDNNGTVTEGNASGINDAAAAVVLMERKAAEMRGLKPIGRLIDYAVAGADLKYTGIGPVLAVKKVLANAGLTLDQIDVFEGNEAFASQAIAVLRELGLTIDKANPNGGAIALGNPLGATGTILTVKTLYELHRVRGRYGLVTMGIGGGQGFAAIYERIDN
jgi:acetyl-CoA C-acetyltransferase